MQEKTLKQVFADIKDDEVWESKEGINGIVVTKEKDGIVIRDNEDNLIVYIADTWKFKLQRKQYTFIEAFKAYEEGKEIESCVSGDRYLWNGLTDLIKKLYMTEFEKLQSIDIKEIKGKWYINEGK